MNERIRELCIRSGAFEHYEINEGVDGDDQPMQRFAELVRADEREACAKVCDEREKANLYGVKECAQAIRARGEK